MKIYREVEQIIQAKATSDGDGVKLKRVFGGHLAKVFDPFLMLDEFGSYDPSDYIAGFPSHPHRGFETVTYMLEGKMEHKDSNGNVGLIDSGDVQWMRAGRGIIHSEMPKQTEGRMRGFQLWVNLPASEKMSPAQYQDIKKDLIPSTRLNHVSIKVIAGEIKVLDSVIKGSVSGLSTEPLYLDIEFIDKDLLELEIKKGHTLLVYSYQGKITLGENKRPLINDQIASFSREGELRIEAEKGAKLLVLSGKPIGESIEQYGPFVMNTREEIQQAIEDYRQGILTGEIRSEENTNTKRVLSNP